MGAVCGKPSSAIKENSEIPRKKFHKNGSSELLVPRVASSRRGGSFRVKEKPINCEVNVGSIDRKVNGSRRIRDNPPIEKKRESFEVGNADYHGNGRGVLKASEAELISVGWPAWFAAVAGEAIKGWVPRRADTFQKLDKIGQGTYSSVYKARDLTRNKVVALKRVRFDNLDPESVKFMAREILILRKLNHPNIIKLEGLVTSRSSCSLYLVFEYMEHDLTGLASLPGIKFTEPQIKCYMQQLLSGLEHCHSHGVLHRDIKGSNLLIDNHGILKIADFGLASFFDYHQNVAMTSRVVTLWYRPPELLLGATHYGISVDLWSAGCILGELYAGKPIMPGRTEVEQLHKIFKLCGSPSEDYWRKSKLPHSAVFKPLHPYKRRLTDFFKDISPAAMGLIDILLSIDPASRGTATSALRSELFTTQPLACHPSSLPKYPPSKEIDAKLRDEEARRQRAAAEAKGVQSVDQRMRGQRESRVNPAPDANAELVTSKQRRKGHVSSRSEVFNSHLEEASSDFSIGPFRPRHDCEEAGKYPLQHVASSASHSGPMVPGVGWSKAGKKYDDVSIVSSKAHTSAFPNSVARRSSLSEEWQDKHGPSQPVAAQAVARISESREDLSSTRKNERRQHQMENGTTTFKEPVLHGPRYTEHKIHFSGPLTNNVDHMLKDHERRLREVARRARIEKARVGKVEAQGPANSIYVTNYGAW